MYKPSISAHNRFERVTEMKAKPILTTFILCAVVFFSSMWGYISIAEKNQVKTEKQRFTVPEIEMPIDLSVLAEREGPKKAVADFTESYILRDNEGTLALFIKYENGDEHIYNTYDIAIKHLPQKDREELSKGIELDSLSSALELVEDYIG